MAKVLEISASTSVLPINIQDWFPLGVTALISLQSKGLSRVFSNTTVQKHQLVGAQPSLVNKDYYNFKFYLFACCLKSKSPFLNIMSQEQLIAKFNPTIILGILLIGRAIK